MNTEKIENLKRPGVLRFMGSQRVRHDWATELNRTETWLVVVQSLSPVWLFAIQRTIARQVSLSYTTLCIRWPKFGASASASVLPMNIQGLFPLALIGLIFLLSKGRKESDTTEWLHFTHSPGDLPDSGIKPGSPALQADSLPSEPQGKCFTWCTLHIS